MKIDRLNCYLTAGNYIMDCTFDFYAGYPGGRTYVNNVDGYIICLHSMEHKEGYDHFFTHLADKCGVFETGSVAVAFVNSPTAFATYGKDFLLGFKTAYNVWSDQQQEFPLPDLDIIR